MLSPYSVVLYVHTSVQRESFKDWIISVLFIIFVVKGVTPRFANGEASSPFKRTTTRHSVRMWKYVLSGSCRCFRMSYATFLPWSCFDRWLAFCFGIQSAFLFKAFADSLLSVRLFFYRFSLTRKLKGSCVRSTCFKEDDKCIAQSACLATAAPNTRGRHHAHPLLTKHAATDPARVLDMSCELMSMLPVTFVRRF